MSTRRTLALLGALAALLLLVALPRTPGRGTSTSSPGAAGDRAPSPATAVVGGSGERSHRRGDTEHGGNAALAALQLRLSPALARAYAAAGALLDGRRRDLAGLDPAALAELAHAEELLAVDRPEPGQQQATRAGADAVMSVGGPAGAPGSGATAPAATTATTGARARRQGETPAADAAPATPAAPAAALPDGAVASSLASSARQPIPVSGTGTTKQLLLPDAWLAIPYQPALSQGQPLVIANLSSGAYAISLVGDDFGDVRLDGGLVVPGRYYRINGTATITATSPVGVHIRPLSAVGPYYDQPLQVPSADG